jgi:acylphosphatase
VQGVGFRWYIREFARQSGLAGWVRNLPDGSVEIVASGDEALIAELRSVARRGPPGAFVSRLLESVAADEHLPQPFSVLR